MGNTVPPRASSREATGTGRRRAWTGRIRCSENGVVVTEAAPPATPSRRVVATVRKQGRDDDDDDGDGDVEEEETTARAGRALRAGGGDGAAPAGKVVITVKIVMTRKDAEALVARLKLKAQSARRRKARMAELEGELRAGSCGGGGASRDARRPTMLPPIKENRTGLSASHQWRA